MSESELISKMTAHAGATENNLDNNQDMEIDILQVCRKKSPMSI
jgi:hypothetical protein